MNSTVREVMTTRVIWVRKDASFREMATALRQHRVSAFPVVDDDGQVIGVVSEADLLAKEALDTEPEDLPGMITGILHRKEAEKARGITAGDLMTSPAIIAHPGDSVEHAARLMHDRRVKRLPVVDEDGRLLGIVSRADLLRPFIRPDAEIRSEILQDVLLRTLWIDPREVEVTVDDGVVRLGGTLESRSVAELVGRVVRHSDGVVDVVNELGYVRDDSDYKPEPGALHGVFESRSPGA